MADTPITIDRLRMDAHTDYANRIEAYREVAIQFPPGQLASLSGQVSMDTVTPQPTNLELLLGNVAVNTPWAIFLAPGDLNKEKKRVQRRMPFGVSTLLPVLGSSEDCTLLQERVLGHACSTQEEERERHSLDNFFGMLQKLNTMAGDVFNSIHRFIHG